MGTESGNVVDLIQVLENQRVWGSLQLNFQAGKLTSVELKQTMKPEATEMGIVQEFLVLRQAG